VAAAPLTGMGIQLSNNATIATTRINPTTARIAVRVRSLDPISEAGILVQLRQRPEIRLAADGEAASVILALADVADDAVSRWVLGLHRNEGAPVVLVIGRVDPPALVSMVSSGVCGVLPRAEATPERLVRLVRGAAQGHGDLPPDLLRHLLDHVNRLNRTALEPRGLSFAGLTEREREVLRLVAEGLSTREVATKLAYSERTIKAVLQAVTLRLRLRNRTQAVAYAVRNGWI
jgi:DNA-binding NarL/FixJ family response regulator